MRRGGWDLRLGEVCATRLRPCSQVFPKEIPWKLEKKELCDSVHGPGENCREQAGESTSCCRISCWLCTIGKSENSKLLQSPTRFLNGGLGCYKLVPVPCWSRHLPRFREARPKCGATRKVYHGILRRDRYKV